VKKARLLPSGEVRLPNGKILGHRDYKHNYKQYYRGMNHDLNMQRIMPSFTRELSLLNPQ